MIVQKKRSKNPVIVYLIMLSAILSSQAKTDARSDYLVKMLENSANYRLRVQAATTLGKLRKKEAVPALLKATEDENELVIISAAIALKQIGDARIVADLEKVLKKTKSKAARSQMEVTIRLLKEIGSGGQEKPESSTKPRFLVRVDAMGNSSSSRIRELPDIMRKLVVERVKNEHDVILQNEKMEAKEIREKLKAERLEGYIISGSIIKMDMQSDKLVVKLGLNLFSNPDYNLLMMPTAEASVNVNKNEINTKAGEDEYSRAVKIVANSLIDTIFDNLRQNEVGH